MRAAQHGTAEIGLAVMATTFTILAVFLPVGFMTGIVGQFFKSFALTIAFAVAMSLFVAFTLDPMLSSRFVRYIPPEERCERGPDVCSNAWVVRMTAWIADITGCFAWHSITRGSRWARRCCIHRQPQQRHGHGGTEFVPAEDRGEFQVILELPGTRSTKASRTWRASSRRFAAFPK